MPANAKKTVCKDKHPLFNTSVKRRNGTEGSSRVGFWGIFFFFTFHSMHLLLTFYKENVMSVVKQ